MKMKMKMLMLMLWEVMRVGAEKERVEVRLEFPSFSFTVGDSSLRNGGLVRMSNFKGEGGGGAVVYIHPISLLHSSFSTVFSFNSSSLSFFISPSNAVPSSALVAVEFDSIHNQVGFHVDSTSSLKRADLKSGNSISSWIDYSSPESMVNVFMSYSHSKPLHPLLSLNFDLSPHLTHPVYLGFSSSTPATSHILRWTFHSSFLPPNNHPHFHILPLPLALAVSFFLAFSFLAFLFIRRSTHPNPTHNFESTFLSCPRAFPYKDLNSATRAFHPSRIVGHGSFGTVYKAFFLSSGTIAAVKRSRHSHQGKTEFLAELSIIAGLRHKNLVQLQGWCVEKGELLLVYDFMPNGSLDKMLYKEPDRGRLLTWSHRQNIALGLASVLLYLHQECEQRVIHRDIKAANILLDGNFNPRLGDFGLAKLMDHDESPVSTLTAGTMGYLAPEYLQYGKATDKTDVFSYGVVVLEVACGRRPIERHGSKMVNLVDWVWELHSQGKLIDAADKRLNGEFQDQEMTKLLLLGLSCANPDSAERPSMRRVLQILNNEATLVVPKLKPTLTFSTPLPLTIEDIVSDAQEFNTSHSICEIKIH
ncbi:hypothetical protein VNO78_32053 [Psophocarpus tetragonolobus]|uniref:non-specific serine/threonine protein kinase n=1 Tax=Psophocarpus tetragonolobus TaxID=3891 RepID=A0AAN9X960_PSOTE